MSSERNNINRVRRLSFETHTLTWVSHKRERERERKSCSWKRKRISFGFYLLSFGASILRKLLLGFSHQGFSRVNLCVLFLCGCACLSFSDLLDYGYVVMMLNVLRYDIAIKNLTWYPSHPERSNCAAETVLQLQLLKIRVSCLKTLKY